MRKIAKSLTLSPVVLKAVSEKAKKENRSDSYIVDEILKGELIKEKKGE